MTEHISQGQFTHGIVLETDRLLLRDYKLSDAEAVLRIRSNPLNLQYMTYTPMDDISQATEWIQTRLSHQNSFNFAVELLSAPGIVIGSCGGIRTPEFGYMFDAPYWGKGYATEAMKAALEAYWATYPDGMPGLEEAKRHYVECAVRGDNAGSVNVVKKLGFVPTDREDNSAREMGHDLEPERIWILERPSRKKTDEVENERV